MERRTIRFFRTALPKDNTEPIVTYFTVKDIRSEMLKKLRAYCQMAAAATKIQRFLRQHLANQGAKKGKILLRKQFKFNGRPFPIDFYYNKKSFKIVVICEGIGQKIIMHPPRFNISRYLTGLKSIRDELELQTKYICLEESWAGYVHIHLYDYTLPTGWELIETENY